jgi:putative ATPase
MHLRNAPTRLMKDLGYGEGYRYPHAEADGFVPDRNLPEGIDADALYRPKDVGAEKTIAARLRAWRERRR